MSEVGVDNVSDAAGFAPLWQLDCEKFEESANGLIPLLLEAIETAAQSVAAVKVEPESIAVKDLRERVKRAILGIDGAHNEGTLERQNALLNILEECLTRHPKYTETVTTARIPPGINFFPKRPDRTSRQFAAMQNHFRLFLLDQGRMRDLGGLSEKAAVGALICSLILRQAVCSARKLSAIMQRLNEPLRVAGDWVYLDISMGGDTRNPPERRRVFLDLVTAALYLRMSASSIETIYPVTIRGLKPNALRRRQSTLLDQCIKAFLTETGGKNNRDVPDTLRKLIHCRLECLRFQVNSVLSEYAQGRLRSTSFVEKDWLRWLQYKSADAPVAAPDESGMMRRRATETTTLEPENETSQILWGEFDTAGDLAKMRAVLRQPDHSRVAEFEKLTDSLTPGPGKFTPEYLLAQWVLSLLKQGGAKRRELRASTILNRLGLFGARMLNAFSRCTDGVPDDDELSDIYLEIIEQAHSPAHESRLAAIIRDFDKFMRKFTGRDAGTSIDGLPTSIGHYQISAHALIPSEFKALQELIRGPESTLTTESGKAIAGSVVSLAYRLGLRRSEVLGLLCRDVHLDATPELILRDNRLRQLKTSNSQRRAPLGLLEREELKQLTRHLSGMNDDDPAFRLGSTKNPVPDHRIIEPLKRMLFATTGDTALHFHHFRHSTASWTFLALMADQIPVHEYHKQLPFLDDVLEFGDKAEKYLVSRFHPVGSRAYAPCELLGHGDPTTTFTHYIHVLDILLFMAIDPHRQRGDQQLQLAAMMMSSNSRTTGYERGKALRSLIREFPGRAIVHLPANADNITWDIDSGSDPALDFDTLREVWLEATRTQETLDHLCPAESDLSLPEPGAQSQAAAKALSTISAALRHDREAAQYAIRLIASTRMKNSDWSSVTADELKAIVRGLGLWGDEATIDLLDVKAVKYPQKRKRLLVEQTNKQIRNALARPSKAGRFRLRLRDQRAASSSKRPDPADRQRQLSQSSVTWTIAATVYYWAKTESLGGSGSETDHASEH